MHREPRPIGENAADFRECVCIKAAIIDGTSRSEREADPIARLIEGAYEQVIRRTQAVLGRGSLDGLRDPPGDNGQGRFESHVHTPSAGSSSAFRSLSFSVDPSLAFGW